MCISFNFNVISLYFKTILKQFNTISSKENFNEILSNFEYDEFNPIESLSKTTEQKHRFVYNE